MKSLLFSIVVVAVATSDLAYGDIAKPMQECEGKNSNENTFNVRHETDCHKFYKCVGGFGFEMECPSMNGVHLVFNPELQVCDWDGVPCTDLSARANYQEPDCKTAPTGNYPHNDCTMYYRCTGGVLVVKHCPQNLFFNEEIGQCDYVECRR